MRTKQPKKMIIISILEILKKYSDVNHTLSQSDIHIILEQEYDIHVERKAIKRNLMNLIDFGFDIEYKEKVRKKKDGSEEIVYTNWYIERDFTDEELRYLIDSILFSKHISNKQCKNLIDKIADLSNDNFKNKIKHIINLPENPIENKELFYNIEILDEAIEKERKVSFTYNEYGTDKKLHPKRIEKYIVNPYQMVATNGRYYLVCNYDKYHNVAHYRIDRITDIEILPFIRKSEMEIKELKNGLNLPKHMAEHIYMFSGDSGTVEFLAKKHIVTEILDWFGKDTIFEEYDDEHYKVIVKVNYKAMRYWALQYVRYVKVLKPESLVQNIKDDIIEGMKEYG